MFTTGHGNGSQLAKIIAETLYFKKHSLLVQSVDVGTRTLPLTAMLHLHYWHVQVYVILQNLNTARIDSTVVRLYGYICNIYTCIADANSHCSSK